MRNARLGGIAGGLCLALAAGAAPRLAAQQFPAVQLPEGYRIEKVVDGLTFPTAIAWDNRGRMYVSEAGGGLDVKQLAPSRILRVEGGRAIEVANLTSQGVHAALIGMTWHDGAFYITHRAQDLTGAVSRVTMDGRATRLWWARISPPG